MLALQEVQRGQARTLARLLHWPTIYWSFKHFPVVKPPEGLAVLSRYPKHAARAIKISRRAPPWSHGRRIAQFVELRLSAGVRLSLCNTHLGTTGPGTRRAQARRIVAEMPAGTVLAGDLNDRPGSPALGVFAGAGLRDSWSLAHPGAAELDAATGWDARTDSPSQRLDYVLVPDGVDVHRATTSLTEGDPAGALALSDHLSMTVWFTPPVGPG